MKYCKRDHAQTKGNTYQTTNGRGEDMTACRLCRSHLARKRYEEDPAYRNKLVKKSRAYRQGKRDGR